MVKDIGKRYLIVLIALLLVIAILSALLLYMYNDNKDLKENQHIKATLAFIDPSTGLYYEKYVGKSTDFVKHIYLNYTGNALRLDYVFVNTLDKYEIINVPVGFTIWYIHENARPFDSSEWQRYMVEKGRYDIRIDWQAYDTSKYTLKFVPIYVYVQ